ncbi:M16 family metallopeptidase [Pedobacter hartonius]|uniref:Zinc protease n=1 Tax=Pedobacter hartonius TaxID=425514 RepID=A0A1H4CTR6_9SPHI|nr:pitrilysin family protein [Pedobacter hartonius]SEA63731.1 zinc protease [Pedobacter hartonius]
MIIKQILLISGLVCCRLAGYSQSAKLVEQVTKKGNELVIPYQKFQFTNGLTVLLTEDHSDPMVHVDVTYHVGSAREEIGKSGFAHFFEHMMFEGSDHVKSGDHFKMVSESGGSLNGSTTQDRTNYYETVPANQLEKMLWLEADRMGFLMDAVTQKKFEIQRSTVKNERGQNYDNQPYGLVHETIARAMYPYGHPYSWLTIGYVEDLNSVNVNDLKRFFMRWYGPNNATLTIGGDINVKQTLAWIEKYFGGIPRGPEVRPTVLPATVLSADRYISYMDNYATQPLLCINFPGVKMYDKDMAALDALSMIIGQGKNSVFYKNFIKGRKAFQASMSSDNSELSGDISIQVVPYPGLTLADMQKEVKAAFAEFERSGVSDDDLNRFKNSSESGFIGGLASVSGKVSALAAAQTFTGNPNQIGTELAEIRRVTKDDVMRVYKKYIKNKSAVILSVLPKSGSFATASADNFTLQKGSYIAPDYGYAGLQYKKPLDKFDRQLVPVSGPNPLTKVPPYWEATSANGIKYIGSFNNEIPTVSFNISIHGGGLLSAKAPSKAGLPAIVAQMLNDDTQSMTAEQISSKLAMLGSAIQVGASSDETSFSVSTLTKNLDATMEILRERLLHPKFTEEALDRIKKQTIEGFQTSKTQPATIATSIYSKLIYGKDNIRVYATNGKEETVKNITLADVQAYYDQYFAPNLCSVVVVGELSEADTKSKFAFLNDWKRKEVEIPKPLPPSSAPPRRTIYFVNVPRAAQSEIRLGYYTGINYDTDSVYYKLALTNYVLGGGFNCRLNLDLREEKGWTYGASSGFASGKNGGIFTAQTGVVAAATDSAALELVKIIQNYAENGITNEELLFTKNSIGQSDALRFETNGQKASFLYRIQTYGLKPGFITKQSRVLKELTKTEVEGFARKYLNTDQMTMVIVGDKDQFGPSLLKAGFDLVELDNDGNKKS